MIRKTIYGVLLASALSTVIACAHVSEADQNWEIARTKGKYAVRLTTDAESVLGTCKFVRMVSPDADPVRPPTDAELPDWLRAAGAFYGADTVVVRERVGDLYICGPAPLNPDGTRSSLPPPK